MINILYLSAALIAIAFLVLVIYLCKTLKSLHITLDRVSSTLSGLEKQMDGVTSETTKLLHKTNALASDIQHKSESLNSVVDAVKEVGTSVRKFNSSIQAISASVNEQVENNKDKLSQVIQWSSVLLEIKDKWKSRKESQINQNQLEELAKRKKERSY